MRYFVSVLLGVFLSVTSFGQTLNQEKLNNYFDALVHADKMMGAAILVKEGHILYQYAFGYADMEAGIKNSVDTEFRIGSISKMFTSVLILRAVEDGMLDLDSTIEIYFPEVENASEISIQHLLQHRSGIRSFTEGGQYLTWHTNPKTRMELYEILVSQGSEFAPNTQSSYSNSNYVLLTWLLEDIYGKDYSELLEEQITGPLGLTSTKVGGKIDTSVNQAKSYVMQVDWVLSDETDMSIPLGAGAITSNLKDLTTFIQALFDGQLIQSSLVEKMMTIQDNFGLGMLRIPFHEFVSYGHTGGIDGFRSVVSYFPDEKLAVAFASNGADYDTNLAPITILSAYFGKDFNIPEFNQEKLAESELKRLIGDYASAVFPLELSFSLEGGKLMGRATGQPSFPLTYEGDYLFSFNPANLTIQFDPELETMILKQGGMTFEFKKK